MPLVIRHTVAGVVQEPRALALRALAAGKAVLRVVAVAGLVPTEQQIPAEAEAEADRRKAAVPAQLATASSPSTRWPIRGRIPSLRRTASRTFTRWSEVVEVVRATYPVRAAGLAAAAAELSMGHSLGLAERSRSRLEVLPLVALETALPERRATIPLCPVVE